ncbi:MAG: hypothetical protein NVSMB70_18260 [Chamaesiphon sp.]
MKFSSNNKLACKSTVRRAVLIALGATFSLGFGQIANALNFNLNYDSSVTSNPNSASIQSSTQYVANEFSSLFSNNVTLNIDVIANSNVGLGQSSVAGYTSQNYGSVRNALIANTPSLANSPSSLPSSDPGLSSTYFVPNAEAKALGFTPQNAFATGPDGQNYDGLFSFNPTYSFSFSKNSPPPAGGYDFIALTEHELSEIMGRIKGVANSTYNASPYDLFSFTSPGTRSYNANVAGAYFSIDNGTTNLNTFNNGSNGGDSRDWAGNTLDPFNAFATPGTTIPLVSNTPVDITAMNAIGWTSASSVSVPEPTNTPLTVLAYSIFVLGSWQIKRTINHRLIK